MADFTSHTITYPFEWEEEYCSKGYVACWREKYPDQMEGLGSTCRSGTDRWTLDLFAQYALMYLLRDRQYVQSITWYELADTSIKSKNQARTAATPAATEGE